MTKRGRGRPRKLTPKQAREIVDAYFEEIEKHKEDRDIHKKVPTVSGLCVKLGIDRVTLFAWSREKTEYSNIARSARTRLQQFWEPLLLRPGSGQGVSFWLRNQGWNDDKTAVQAEAKHSDGSSIKVTFSVVGTDQQLAV